MSYKIQYFELYKPESLLGVPVTSYEEPGQIINGYVIYFLKVCSTTMRWK